jgi:hypothetical protein
VGEEFHGVDMGEGAVRLALADGGAYGFDDHSVTHGMPLRSVQVRFGVRSLLGSFDAWFAIARSSLESKPCK